MASMFWKDTVPLTHFILIQPSPFGLICCFLVIRFKLHSWQGDCVSDWGFSLWILLLVPFISLPKITGGEVLCHWIGYHRVEEGFSRYWIQPLILWGQVWKWPTGRDVTWSSQGDFCTCAWHVTGFQDMCSFDLVNGRSKTRTQVPWVSDSCSFPCILLPILRLLCLSSPSRWECPADVPEG